MCMLPFVSCLIAADALIVQVFANSLGEAGNVRADIGVLYDDGE
jgi:hypothetical protein